MLRASPATYVPPFTPTGLTGILTHPLPRQTLIGVYSQTLDALKELPSTSVYRQSVENITKTRLAAVEAVKPYGYDEYQKKVESILQKNGLSSPDKKRIAYLAVTAAQFRAILNDIKDETHPDDLPMLQRLEEEQKVWDDRLREAIAGKSENDVLPNATLDQANAVSGGREAPPATPPPAGSVSHNETKGITEEDEKLLEALQELPREPALTRAQIASIENQIGAGLVEEVITQGVNELNLIKEMKEAKPWEDLEETAPEGQWVYFERKP